HPRRFALVPRIGRMHGAPSTFVDHLLALEPLPDAGQAAGVEPGDGLANAIAPPPAARKPKAFRGLMQGFLQVIERRLDLPRGSARACARVRGGVATLAARPAGSA
ncbi:MAG TPA: hypothetical protein VKB35_19490, partial [Ktedonobacteraceae bacterium]|nr:hypothetical protein [Ktedonobacteraceae bacterium]